jgi:hypothetical protein
MIIITSKIIINRVTNVFANIVMTTTVDIVADRLTQFDDVENALRNVSMAVGLSSPNQLILQVDLKRRKEMGKF